MARILGLIDDNDFEIINSIRDARNDFAHKLDCYSMMEQEQISENTRLIDAIRLYENLLNIDNSMIEENED